MKTIYILSEDKPARTAIAAVLKKKDYLVYECAAPDELRANVDHVPPDLLLLEIRPEDARGYDLVWDIRTDCRTGRFPIIVVAPEASEEDIMTAFENGADDFIMDPYASRELLTRVKIRLNAGKPAVPQVLQLGAIRLNTGTHEVFADEKKVYLTAREHRLLLLFMQNPGIVLTGEEMTHRICGKADTDKVRGRSVDMLVCTLRRKLGAQGGRIKTVRAAGYLMRADGEAPCREA